MHDLSCVALIVGSFFFGFALGLFSTLPRE
jgi:hypothetical protein